MGLIKKILAGFFTLIIILSIWLVSNWFLPTGEKKDYVVNVEVGDSAATVAKKLNAIGLDLNPTVFSALAHSRKVDQKIKVGRYTFVGPISLWKVINQFANTKSTEIKITLIEGWSARQIGEYLEKQGLVNADDFWTFVNEPPSELYTKYPFLKRGKSLEGFLFPDTYQVYRNASIEELVTIFLDNFESKVGAAGHNNWTSGFYDQLILASIVQDEVGSNKDMANVADIFWKRLQTNMPLQSDATINYFTNKGMASPLITDTQIDNPYNTYKYKGLPPGPISNPGVLAITSVLNPIDNPYFYFLTTKTGEVIYSKTFEEHLKNKNKYLK